MSYGDLVVIVLSTVLRIKRTLDGAEIDKIIADVEAEGVSRRAPSPRGLVQARGGIEPLSRRM